MFTSIDDFCDFFSPRLIAKFHNIFEIFPFINRQISWYFFSPHNQSRNFVIPPPPLVNYFFCLLSLVLNIFTFSVKILLRKFSNFFNWKFYFFLTFFCLFYVSFRLWFVPLADSNIRVDLKGAGHKGYSCHIMKYHWGTGGSFTCVFLCNLYPN